MRYLKIFRVILYRVNVSFLPDDICENDISMLIDIMFMFFHQLTMSKYI